METQQTENIESVDQADPWAAAFEALNKVDEETDSPDANTGEDAGGEQDSAKDDEQEVSSEVQHDDNDGVQARVGESNTDSGDDNSQDSGSSGSVFDVSYGDLEQYKQDTANRIRNQAIDEIAAEFLKRDDVRKTNGKLGATINDSDICKRDEDGVPHFFNPETGREFSGDNPRAQAQQWVDAYNKELARVFNDACSRYEQFLSDKSAPELAAASFAKTYKNLDPIRKGMLDNILQDYEVKNDKGKVIGYSCDLEKAMALVDRQVSMIQNYAKEHSKNNESKKTNNQGGPALDMKTSSGAIPSGDAPAPKSLAEALEQVQNRELEKIRNK